MLRRQFETVLLFASLLAVLCRAGHAAEVLQQLPPDALGFAVIRDIGATDGKLEQLAAALQLRTLGPLQFVRTATGIGEGLDLQGEFMLAAIPSDQSRGQMKFCVWLPTTDYERLLSSLGTKPAEGITAVTIAGEDLLVVSHGKWAVVMDPDQRERMQRMFSSATQAPVTVAPWQKSVDTNDVTIVAFSGGVQQLLRIVAANQPSESQANATEVGDDLFGDAAGDNRNSPPDAAGDENAATGIVANIRRAVNNFHLAAPELAQRIGELESVGIGMRIDGDQNVLTSLRAIWKDDGQGPTQLGPSATAGDLAPNLFHGGEFMIHGAANLQPALAATVATSYVRLRVNELTSGEGIRFDETSLVRFYEAVGQAASEGTAATVLTLPGEKEEGVYTNSFLAVRVDTADKFVDLTTEAMRLWNQINRDGRGGLRLVFDVEELSIGDRKAIQYSLDLADADGAAVLPETRQAMEKLFGPGGKLRMLIAKVDEHTVLLAGATPEQVAAMLEQLDRKQRLNWQQPPFADVNRLLPNRADWRAFFSPHGYTMWKTRESAAIVGTEVIGGPIVKEFPAAQPIGIAGVVTSGELWMDIAMPAETMRGAGVYLQPKRRVRLQR
jgi:hypothetical protein